MRNEKLLLDETIEVIKIQQTEQLALLKEQFYNTYESLKPVNLIKDTFNQLITSPELKGNLMNNIIGLATGYVSRKILFRSSAGPVMKVAGKLLQFVVSNFVSKHPDGIKNAGENILAKIVSAKNKHDLNYSDNTL
jgi:hypothetical protein